MTEIVERWRKLYEEACATEKGHRMYPHPWGKVCKLIEELSTLEQERDRLRDRVKLLEQFIEDYTGQTLDELADDFASILKDVAALAASEKEEPK